MKDIILAIITIVFMQSCAQTRTSSTSKKIQKTTNPCTKTKIFEVTNTFCKSIEVALG